MKPAQPRLLLVEDDDALRDTIADYFGLKGYAVTAVSSGSAFVAQLAKQPVNLILLDLNLPDADGLELLRGLREASRAPVFILSGRADLDSRLTGLELGADDFIVKPFDLRELELRLRNFITRRREVDLAPTLTPLRVWMRYDWRLDLPRLIAQHADGTVVHLTAGEALVLDELFSANGRLVRRERLAARARAAEIPLTDESLPVLISRLRRKLRASPARPWILAVPGQGYQLADLQSSATCAGSGR